MPPPPPRPLHLCWWEQVFVYGEFLRKVLPLLLLLDLTNPCRGQWARSTDIEKARELLPQFPSLGAPSPQPAPAVPFPLTSWPHILCLITASTWPSWPCAPLHLPFHAESSAGRCLPPSSFPGASGNNETRFKFASDVVQSHSCPFVYRGSHISHFSSEDPFFPSHCLLSTSHPFPAHLC